MGCPSHSPHSHLQTHYLETGKPFVTCYHSSSCSLSGVMRFVMPFLSNDRECYRRIRLLHSDLRDELSSAEVVRSLADTGHPLRIRVGFDFRIMVERFGNAAWKTLPYELSTKLVEGYSLTNLVFLARTILEIKHLLYHHLILVGDCHGQKALELLGGSVDKLTVNHHKGPLDVSLLTKSKSLHIGDMTENGQERFKLVNDTINDLMIRDYNWSAYAQSMPNVIDLEGLPALSNLRLSNVSAKHLIFHAPNLLSMRLTDVMVQQTIDLSSMVNIKHISIRDFNGNLYFDNPNLEELCIQGLNAAGTQRLTPAIVVVQCPKLRRVELARLNVIRVEFDCPSLERLHIMHFNLARSADVDIALFGCPALKHLKIQHARLHGLDITTPELETIKLEGINYGIDLSPLRDPWFAGRKTSNSPPPPHRGRTQERDVDPLLHRSLTNEMSHHDANY